MNDAAGTALAVELERVHYAHCDVASWESLVALFGTAKAHSSTATIDIVFSNAGAAGRDTLLDWAPSPAAELCPVAELLPPPEYPDIHVNLSAAFSITRLALHQFQRQGGHGRLVFTGSAAPYLDTPPLWVYTAAKHGVLGLMRSLRAPAAAGTWGSDVAVNLVAPWYTRTPMTAKLAQRWGDRPANSPQAVARVLVFAAVAREWRAGGVSGRQPVGTPLNGCGFFVGGDRAVEVERVLIAQRPAFLADFAAAIADGQATLGGW